MCTDITTTTQGLNSGYGHVNGTKDIQSSKLFQERRTNEEQWYRKKWDKGYGRTVVSTEKQEQWAGRTHIDTIHLKIEAGVVYKREEYEKK